MRFLSTKYLRLFAFSILLIPVAAFAVFSIGGLVTGNFSSVYQFILVAPLLLIAALGRKKPFVAGSILLIVAITMAVTYHLSLADLPLNSYLLTEIFLFAPPAVAGVTFMILGHRENK